MCLRGGQFKNFAFKMESSKTANMKTSQFEILVEFMMKQPDLSMGYLKTPEARQKSRHLWTNLSEVLNAEGPPQRDAVGWKKVWADFKVHTKAKLRKNKINLSGTGGGPPKYHSLTPLEEKVSELLDLGQAIDGMNGSLSFGLHDISSIQEQLAEADDGDADIIYMLNDVVDNSEINLNDVLSTEKENIPQQRITPKKRQTSLLKK
ncbi:uncharacterized protein LOC129943516 [Eupeodes corollae]|uniref:uncharacterized protein LOC129943516 n=1 Tax=Eupeodes corollae TaxID=290404 RepID=UPI00249317B9|nr:uncharacterized protein LOC129943516 [Eupeodes corollae]